MSGADLPAVFDLTGRVAVVTGAASGIGEAAAVVLASAGAHLAIADRDEQGLAAVAGRIEDSGGSSLAFPADVSRKRDLDALIARTEESFGRLDVMCNVAGVRSEGPLSDVTEDELDRVIAINLKSVLFGCQAALPVMVRQGSGSIINVSSSIADHPTASFGVYALTKAGVNMLTMTLAAEAGPHGIRVNALAPGPTDTNFSTATFTVAGLVDEARHEEWRRARRSLSPLGLVGTAIDQAYLILYLASDAARFATGNIFRVNGGLVMA